MGNFGSKFNPNLVKWGNLGGEFHANLAKMGKIWAVNVIQIWQKLGNLGGKIHHPNVVKIGKFGQ